jgi:dihydroxyacetone kinase-like predicted kinase
VVVESAPGAEPPADALLAAIRDTGAGDVVLLPNGCRTELVEQVAEAARRTGQAVAVVPTRSAVQGLAALSVRDPVRRFADDVIIMAEAAGATRSAEVTVATRDALTSAGPCRAGDVLGLAEGDVVLLGEQVGDVAALLLDRLLGAGGELVTIVLGADAGDLREPLGAHLRCTWPMVECVIYDGGQPDCTVLVGVE